MTLFDLMTEKRGEILEKCKGKVAEVMGSRSTTYQLEQGLPTLYDELVEVLRISLEDESPGARQQFVTKTILAGASRRHAQESYRLGYTVSQLVHGYGCICQGITEYAHETNGAISAVEFSQLNLCLDVAIAQAVSEFENLSLENASNNETLRLGFLLHELRNYLSNAMMAHEVIRRGGAGAAGATSSVLTNAHRQMKEIVDRAMAEARLRTEPTVNHSRLNLLSLLGEVESASLPEANAKGISLRVSVDRELEVEGDRHLVISAFANLVQNAIKYSRPKSMVWIRGYSQGGEAIIEVEDQCGGLLEGKTEAMFEPYVQGNSNKGGMGLGLSIARRAIELNSGQLNARSLPGVGCIFTVRMPDPAQVSISSEA